MHSVKICPVCSGGDYNSLSDGLHRCNRCKSVFNSEHSLPEYDENYFLDDYRNQYGKTYIEDFHHIYKLSEIRIKQILDLMGNPSEISSFSLLDIGSAAGFFLKSALDNGIGSVEGVEISAYASEYCRNEFGIDVVNDSLEDVKFEKKYNIISAWYYIEHNSDPVSVIKDIYSLLQDGGLFAFSVPSVFGPMFTFNRGEWIDTHPVDHSVDFHPGAVKDLLKRTGFRKVMIKPAGFHPERIVDRDSIFFNSFSFLYRGFASLFGFSDTMEIYAIK